MYEPGVGPNGEPGWYYTGPDGVRQFYADPGASGSAASQPPTAQSYPTGTPISNLNQLPAGNAVIRDQSNRVVQDDQGNYYYVPGEGDAQYTSPGHPAYDQAVVPTIRPEVAEEETESVDDSGDWGGYRNNYNSYGGSRGSTYGSGYREPSRPSYADGSMHPAWGGQPRVAGGFSNNDGSASFRQQVYVPGGAAAGPFETRAARGVSGSRGGYSGGGGGGGGGGSALYRAWRDKLTSKLYPGSGSGYSGGGGSGGGRSGGSSGYSSGYSYPPSPPPMGPDPWLLIQAETATMDPRWQQAYNTVGAKSILDAQENNFKLEQRAYRLQNRASRSNHPERIYRRMNRIYNRYVPPYQYVERNLF